MVFLRVPAAPEEELRRVGRRPEDRTEELACRRLAVRARDGDERVGEQAETELDLAPGGDTARAGTRRQRRVTRNGRRGRERYALAVGRQRADVVEHLLLVGELIHRFPREAQRVVRLGHPAARVAELVYQTGFSIANTDRVLRRDNKGPRTGFGSRSEELQ